MVLHNRRSRSCRMAESVEMTNFNVAFASSGLRTGKVGDKTGRRVDGGRFIASDAFVKVRCGRGWLRWNLAGLGDDRCGIAHATRLHTHLQGPRPTDPGLLALPGTELCSL